MDHWNEGGIPKMKGNFCRLCAVLDGAEDNEQQNIPNDNEWFTVVEQYGKMTGIVVRQLVDGAHYISQITRGYNKTVK